MHPTCVELEDIGRPEPGPEVGGDYDPWRHLVARADRAGEHAVLVPQQLGFGRASVGLRCLAPIVEAPADIFEDDFQ